MTEITQAMKITAIAGDIYQGMTQKEVDAFVIRQIEASLELLPETDINEMHQEILAEIKTYKYRLTFLANLLGCKSSEKRE